MAWLFEIILDPSDKDAAPRVVNRQMDDLTRDLIRSLTETLRSLEIHLDDDTHLCNLKHRDLLCPCNQQEVARAKAVLARCPSPKEG
jgi:hypothetical protein